MSVAAVRTATRADGPAIVAIDRAGFDPATTPGAAEVRMRGARRLTLRVLGTNPSAQALYASEGFEVEGVQRGEFVIDGAEVDDVLMARRLG